MARHPNSKGRRGLNHIFRKSLNVAASEAAEKLGFGVILSEAKNLSPI
jgi:hypothetical protein